MQNIEALYSTYATNSSNNAAIDFEAKLSQYKDQFSITITDTEIIFGEGKESISSLLQRKIDISQNCGFVDGDAGVCAGKRSFFKRG